MAANALIQARIDGKLKHDAAAVLASVGLTVSDAIRLMLIKVVEEKALPFDIWKPNAETRAAMGEAEAMIHAQTAHFANAEALFDDLDKKISK